MVTQQAGHEDSAAALLFSKTAERALAITCKGLYGFICAPAVVTTREDNDRKRTAESIFSFFLHMEITV